MATSDVPGARKENRDKLATGCWAEHEDGSLIFVEGIESGKVIYSMFDLSTDPIAEYRDAMPETIFKKNFSWNPKDPKSEKWTWHDKTSFPWDRVIKAGAKDGVRFTSAEEQLSAASRVARSRKLRGAELKKEDIEHMVDVEQPRGLIERLIIKKVQAAIDRLLV